MELTRHTGRVRAVAFALDGQLLASASTDGTVRLWNPATGRPVWELHPERASRRSRRRVLGIPSRTPNARSIWIWAVTFAPDGRLLAAAGDDGTIRLWDTATGRPVWELIEHTGRVPAVAFAPDGRLLASAGDDGTVRLWDTAIGRPVWELTGHTGWVWAVTFAPDGRLLASGGADGTVRLWDPTTGAAMAVLGSDTPVGSLCWASNRIAVGGKDGLFLLRIVVTHDFTVTADNSPPE